MLFCALSSTVLITEQLAVFKTIVVRWKRQERSTKYHEILRTIFVLVRVAWWIVLFPAVTVNSAPRVPH